MNKENNKDKPIDYSKFFEREKSSPVDSSEKKKKKKFSLILLISLKDAWLEMDKKTKIEIIIFLAIIVLIIAIFRF